MSATDLDRLFLAGAEHAARSLTEQENIYPFALGMTVDDRVVAVGVDPGEARPAVEKVLDLLVEGLRVARDELRASVIVSDVRLVVDGTETPALRLELEARDDDPWIVTVTYTPGPELQQPTRAPGVRRVWTD